MRPIPPPYRCADPGFNSRTREDATHEVPVTVGGVPVSIHAPVRMRLSVKKTTVDLLSFNSRTREDATG